MFNPQKIEKKWQSAWTKKKLFEANIEPKKKKYFVTFPYPYMNGAPHVGHSYSFFRTDGFARFKRMQGYNVLFPQGFHATGEPILGVIERLKKGDLVQKETLKQFDATERDIKTFMKDPTNLVFFFIKKWIEVCKKSGYSIDWRRTFVTTTLTPTYSRFVEWQYNTLKKKGYVVQGTHPVIWCPKDQSPTGDHDRLKGDGESPQEYTLLLFAMGEYVLPAATLRPETIYGVTNMWVNPDASYVVLDVAGKQWIVSEDAAYKIKDQMHGTRTIDAFDIHTIIGKKCHDPVGNKEVPILPAHFVDPEHATGIVMSVPAHAPYDWVALRELINGNMLETYGLTKNDVEPITIISTPGLSEHPAEDFIQEKRVVISTQQHELDEATNALYKKEFHRGVLNDKCGPYAGRTVRDVKDDMIATFMDMGAASHMWEPTAEVVCRCTTKCHVKILENQWFLKFSDETWKAQVREHVKHMTIYPHEAKNNVEQTIDWLKDKACTRKSGLGTPLPWDKSWIVETLSDSTIYMAYYTINRLIFKNHIRAAQLTDEAFDYIFLGHGDLKTIAKKTKIKPKVLAEMRKEFLYFYPLDMRNSGKDLIQNHLTFFLFHHAAIFPKKLWPRGISVNGYVNVEGEKMSKSKGNVIPLKNLIDEFGSDLVRINIVSSSEGLDDADWRVEHIKSYRSRLEFLFDVTHDLKQMKGKQFGIAEQALLSKMQQAIRETTTAYEHLTFRTGSQHAVFATTADLKWYIRRAGGVAHMHKKTVQEALSVIVRLMAPIAPHAAEELWSLLGNKPFVATASWPVPDKKKDNTKAERAERLIAAVVSDIEEIKTIAKIGQPKTIMLFVAEGWKFDATAHYEKERDPKALIATLMKTDAKQHGNRLVAYIRWLAEKAPKEQPLSKKEQLNVLRESKLFLEQTYKASVMVQDADKADNPKSQSATPFKCGILLT
ncbi:MAG: leucine--tRNA ligase [Candidatus Aenigmarchaeota archaeon]|nr:leucine--tRNA ligase [Candidatus Aenigmarchaeota archaeon]